MLSVIVPCYNEERNVPLLAERFSKVLKGHKAELILVDNGSYDNTRKEIQRQAKKHKMLKLSVVEKNVGYGNGIVTGLKAAKGEVLAWTHADLQCDPEDIIRAYEIFKKRPGFLVKGNRKGRFSLLTLFFHVVASVLFLRRFDDINGQPKLFPRELFDTFRSPPLGFQLDFYIQYKALRHGFGIVSFPVRFGKRKHGKSKWSSSLKSRIKNISAFLGYMLKLRLLGE